MSTSMHVICHKKTSSNTLKLLLLNSKVLSLSNQRASDLKVQIVQLMQKKVVDLPVQKDNEDIVLDIVSPVKI